MPDYSDSGPGCRLPTARKLKQREGARLGFSSAVPVAGMDCSVGVRVAGKAGGGRRCGGEEGVCIVEAVRAGLSVRRRRTTRGVRVVGGSVVSSVQAASKRRRLKPKAILSPADRERHRDIHEKWSRHETRLSQCLWLRKRASPFFTRSTSSSPSNNSNHTSLSPQLADACRRRCKNHLLSHFDTPCAFFKAWLKLWRNALRGAFLESQLFEQTIPSQAMLCSAGHRLWHPTYHVLSPHANSSSLPADLSLHGHDGLA
ncbi:hypothetical protein Q7P37_004676 [Cladosporium fusiforme]